MSNNNTVSSVISQLISSGMVQDPNKMQLKNVDIKHDGNVIILPFIQGKPMAYEEAIHWLKRKQEEENQRTSIHYEIKGNPLDAAIAFHKAMAQTYGWTQMVPTPSFFGPNPPTMVKLPVSEEEFIEVAIGRMEIPGIEGYLETDFRLQGKNPCFIIAGEVKKKYVAEIHQIAHLTEDILKTDSIYRGKAIKVDFSWMRSPKQSFNPISDCPKFMSFNKDDNLIFGKKVMDALKVGLFTPIEQSAACREHKIPLKRGILLHGPYGTGKTLTAYTTALKAVSHGWTFIYLNSVEDLREGLEFAAMYAPAVLFAEDVDRVITGERTLDMDSILNILDGVDTKNAEILTVFTTNHLENINPAMLRMGRLDTLIEVTPPDAEAAIRLVQLYGRELIDPKADIQKIGKVLEGRIPAFIREVVERAKMAAIGRIGADIRGKVIEGDLIEAANAMESHVALLENKKSAKQTNPEMLIRIPKNHKEANVILKSLSGGKK